MTERRKEKDRVLDELRMVDPELRVTWHKRTNIPRRIKGKLSETMKGEPEEIARTFLSERKRLFGISDVDEEFVLRRVARDKLGMNHVRLVQHYKGVPVYGGELVVHIDKKNVVTGVHGNYQPDIEINIEPSISKESAIENARKHAESKTDKILVEPELRIFTRKDKPTLAWQFVIEGTDVDFRGAENPAEWLYLIDAHTGDFVHRSNQLIAACTPSNGSGQGYYSGVHNGTLNTCYDSENNKYLLQDKSRTGIEIVTHDLDGSLSQTLDSISEDSDNNWDSDVIPPRKDHQGAEVDAHYYTGIVHDYYKEVHERNSFDNAGSNMIVKVHYRVDYPNAYYSRTYRKVYVCDGDDVDFNYLSELDILAHEWTHGVHHNESDYDYSEEPGAVAESMADFFACMIDKNWLIGKESFKKQNAADALRNLEDPTNGGKYVSTNPFGSVSDGYQPDHMDDKYTCSISTHPPHTAVCDYGGVHVNSGIPNKAAYLIIEGGTHNNIKICYKLGRSLGAKLYYRALTTYLNDDSDFEDLRDALLDSVDDVFESRSSRTNAATTVRNAFAAVGIGDPAFYPYHFAQCYLIPYLLLLFAWVLPPLLFLPIYWPLVFPPGPDPIAIQISAFLGIISLIIAIALTYRMLIQRK